MRKVPEWRESQVPDGECSEHGSPRSGQPESTRVTFETQIWDLHREKTHLKFSSSPASDRLDRRVHEAENIVFMNRRRCPEATRRLTFRDPHLPASRNVMFYQEAITGKPSVGRIKPSKGFDVGLLILQNWPAGDNISVKAKVDGLPAQSLTKLQDAGKFPLTDGNFGGL